MPLLRTDFLPDCFTLPEVFSYFVLLTLFVPRTTAQSYLAPPEVSS
jgi:hypothetical protein